MEKNKCLKSYSEKDYTETILFPVELVGRDGVVRKYSYADSIRIYERRIQSAHIRFTDRDVISAEISHCAKRLEQIQRSWKLRLTDMEREYVQGRPGDRDMELYAKGKDCVQNWLTGARLRQEDRVHIQDVNLALLEENEHGHIFYVNCHLLHPGTLLYVYRLQGGQESAAYQKFHEFVELLTQLRHAPDTEKLLHSDSSSDIAFILTSPRVDPFLKRRDVLPSVLVHVVGPEQANRLESGWQRSRGGGREPGHHARGLQALSQRRFEDAFEHFRMAIEDNPYQRDAYWALAEVSELLERWDDAERFSHTALRFLPDEPRAHFYHGRILLRKRALPEAQSSFARSVTLNLDHCHGYEYQACCEALMGRFTVAQGTLEQGLFVFPYERSLQRLLPLVKAMASWRSIMQWVIPVAVLVSALALALSGTLYRGWPLSLSLGAALSALYLGRRFMLRRDMLLLVPPK